MKFTQTDQTNDNYIFFLFQRSRIKNINREIQEEKTKNPTKPIVRECEENVSK